MTNKYPVTEKQTTILQACLEEEFLGEEIYPDRPEYTDEYITIDLLEVTEQRGEKYTVVFGRRGPGKAHWTQVITCLAIWDDEAETWAFEDVDIGEKSSMA